MTLDSAMSFLRRVVRALRQFRVSRDTFYLLGRGLGEGQAPEPPDGFGVEWVEHEKDARFEDLVAISADQGIRRDWCAKELREGLSIVLAMAGTSGPAPGATREAAAMAWMALGEHLIDPILHRFDPGPAGCQLLNCLVRPAHRGRRLQRLLFEHRLARARERGRRWAYTVIRDRNIPSMRNARAEGFVPIVRIDLYHWRGATAANLRLLTHRIPRGRLGYVGWGCSEWVHLLRKPE